MRSQGDGELSRVRNDLFDSSCGLDRGRSKPIEGVWYLLKCLFIMSALPWPSSLRVAILRFFGARIGRGVYIKPRVNILFPWKLSIGSYSWIGEEVNILNFEPIVIGSNTCISQRVFLCAGNHDFRDPAMRYRNCQIAINDGAWIGAQSFVGPGVTIGVDAVATAGSVITKDLPPGSVCSGNPCNAVGLRWKK